MILQDVLDEIVEKLNWTNPNHGMSVPSIIRKITQVRDDLIRNYTPAQRQSEPVVATMDLLKDKAQYPLPCPPGNVVSVEVKGLWSGLYYGFLAPPSDNWEQPPIYTPGEPAPPETLIPSDNCGWFDMPYRQFDERYWGPYYYFLSGTIGLVPKPYKDIVQGLKIFHVPVLSALSVDSLGGPTGFDPNFDMVLVYGVLKDATTGAQRAEHLQMYNQWLSDYTNANSGWERYSVNERW